MENNTPQQKNKIAEILEKIEKNEIKIHPKTYFRIKFAVLLVLVFAILLVSIFLSSFILFSLRASGYIALIGLGLNGWKVFFLLFPWKLFILEIILILLLEWLLRSFKFAYKIPVLYLILMVLVVMIISGLIVVQTPLHNELLRQYNENRLPPPLNDLYGGVRNSSPPPQGYGIFRGTVVSIDTNALAFITNIDNPGGGSATPFKIIISDQQLLGGIKIGDVVFIEGNMVNGEIHATNIRASIKLPS